MQASTPQLTLLEATASHHDSLQHILTTLQSRYQHQEPYTRLGDRVLLSLNPSTSLPIHSESTSKEYVSYHQQTATGKPGEPGSKHVLGAHLFDTVCSAWFHGVRLGEHQTLLLSGECGSGKTHSHQLIIQTLCDLSRFRQKKTILHSLLLKYPILMASFAHTATTSHAFKSTTKCGVYAEYQFTAQGKLAGAKVCPLLFDRHHLTHVPSDEANFNIFYQMLAGLSVEEKQALRLTDASSFHYLNQSKYRSTAASQLIDAANYQECLSALSKFGVSKKSQVSLVHVLAGILHLGNIQFAEAGKNGEACEIRNRECVWVAAELLGVAPESLEQALIYRTILVQDETCSILLNIQQANNQRDQLAETLYQLCFDWLMDTINSKLITSDYGFILGVVDFPGWMGNEKVPTTSLYSCLFNFAQERLGYFAKEEFFHIALNKLKKQQVPVNDHPPMDKRLLDLFANIESSLPLGILPIVESFTTQQDAVHHVQDQSWDQLSLEKIYQEHATESNASPGFLPSKKNRGRFGIKHAGGRVEYSTDGWVHQNTGFYSTDAVTLFRGSSHAPASSNPFVRLLFSSRILSAMPHPKSQNNIVAAKPKLGHLAPSLLPNPLYHQQKALEEEEELMHTVSGQFRKNLEDLIVVLGKTRLWHIVHLKKSDKENYADLDLQVLRRQVETFDLVELTTNPAALYTVALTYEEFADKYDKIVSELQQSDQDLKDLLKSMAQHYGWEKKDISFGTHHVFLSESSWRALEDQVRSLEQETSLPNTVENTPQLSRRNSFESDTSRLSVARSSLANIKTNADKNYPESEWSAIEYSKDEFDVKEYVDLPYKEQVATKSPDVEGAEKTKDVLVKNVDAAPAKLPPKPKKKLTAARKRWVCCTWCLTWWIWPVCLSVCGKMKRKDIQMAWREKLALNIIIFLLCASMLFYIVGLARIICPDRKLLKAGELERFKGTDYPYVAVQDKYYLIGDIVKDHTAYGYANLAAFKQVVYGRLVTPMFDKTLKWETYCKLTQPPGWKPFPVNDFPSDAEKVWFPHMDTKKDYFKMIDKYRKGTITLDQDGILAYIAADQENNRILVVDGNIYDFSTYLSPTSQNFLGDYVKTLVQSFGKTGTDVSAQFRRIKSAMSANDYNKIMDCMNNMMKIGVVDTRLSPQCLFSNYVLLASTIVLILVIGLKFLGALQMSSRRSPEDHDKFVILQVPCYTEGPESLSKTFESLANTIYDDRRKLLFVICDGMIIGSGNDRPTPRIALDILGVPHSVDPEPKLFPSLGDGNKQVNMAKVYSGLYENTGRKIPFIVVVKVGKPSERSRPGNRGKRDSQMILMKYLNKAQFNSPMNPLELDIYHHMKNIIGIEPRFFEYVLMVDADTEVMPDSLNRMVAVMIRDSKVIGLCGETLISNEGDTWVTMMQVYEYFISHHMAKSFESLFGTVTCLPGCFSMYRIKIPSPDGRDTPILTSPDLIKDYSDNQNLLHLGEDRYLTTLMLKYFPQFKLCFTVDAKCKTNVPDRWKVFLSQRRRWINSTVHNLLELLMLPQLCGFCLLSMRFLVFLDLFATLVQPASLLYVGYLVYAVMEEDIPTVPQMSLIMLAAIYGLQLIIIILKREWQNIGWMIIYIIFMPFWAFYLPVYAFWRFDDFSWGNTRVVLGESGKKIYAVDIEEVEQVDIPEKTWAEYEQELMAQAEVRSVASLPLDSMPIPHYQDDAMSVASGMRPPSYYQSSLVHRPASLRAASTYSSSTRQGPSYSVLPPDHVLVEELRQLLSTANLMSTTKRQIREELSRRFGGIDLSKKRDLINKTIDEILGNI